jgi:NHL repeat-containing protein
MQSRTRRGVLCAGMIYALFCLASFVWVPRAVADISFCPTGSGAGQCREADGVATDFETGHVYVADTGNNRIDVFEADGKFVMVFGWGVKDGKAEPQTCGPATPELNPEPSLCQKGIAGSGAGQLSIPRAIAVDNSSATTPPRHDVYVVTNDSRVQRFGPEGDFRLGFGWGVRDGKKEAQTCGPEASPPSVKCQGGIGGGLGEKGKCQVSRSSDPVAVGPGGIVHLADSAKVESGKLIEAFVGRIEQFEPSGACLEETVLFEEENHVLSSLAVDSGSNVYAYLERISEGKGEVIRKYPPKSNAPVCGLDEGLETRALAIDSEDHLFAGQGEPPLKPGGNISMLTEYSSACKHLRRFSYGSGARGIAALHPSDFPGAQGDVFSTLTFEGKEVHYISLPGKPGPIVAPTPEASGISNTKATLGAEVNPEGKASTAHFDYVDEATYLKDIEELGPGHGFDHAIPTKGELLEENPEDPDEFKLHLAKAPVGCPDPVKEAPEEGNDCLAPETTYRFQAVAENPDGKGNSPVEGEPFTTAPSLEFGDAWSTAVGIEAARIHTEVNPFGIPAIGHFEYVDDATFQKDVEELGPGHGFDHATQVPNVSKGQTPLDLGEAEVLSDHSATLSPLSQGTTYHYRLIAQNPLIDSRAGPERTFRTFVKQTPESCPANEAFRTGPAALLPDCRAYELVSPLEKNNGDVVVLDEPTDTRRPAVLNKSSRLGAKLAYGSYRPFGDIQAGPFNSQYLATRDAGAEEWLNLGISPPRERPIYNANVTAATNTEFKAFSDDLCEAWIRTVWDPPLAEGGIAGFPNIYRHREAECGSGPGYETLTNTPWPNLAQGNANEGNKTELQGVSADGDTVIFIAFDSLEGSGAPEQPAFCIGEGKGCNQELYVSTKGASPVFVCVLPNSEGLAQTCSGGTGSQNFPGRMRSSNVQGALSGDGSRVFWTDQATGLGEIYLREHPEQGQVTEECTPGKACTIAVSKKGEEESGTSQSRFLAASDDGSKALFATVDAGKKIADLYLFDVATETTRLITHHALPTVELSGILGTSADLSHVYFASTDAMGGANSEGALAKAGQPNLYLDEEGTVHFIGTLASLDVAGDLSPIEVEPLGHVARVAPDGESAAFMSSAPLTGYDNTDAKNGEANFEVFLYDASADGGADELTCASCNPANARPVGENIRGKLSPLWAAAHIPVFENTLYASRVLSNDGRRLYFESSDTLVARDTNGKPDVYQWEAVGKGGCDKADATLSPLNEGCIDLISSGQSARGSEIVDMSPSGNDVFFATLSSLVPQDYGLVDIYDARVNGGFEPPNPGNEECEGEACQSPPAPPIPPTPATSTAGNAQTLPPEAKKPCPKGKKQVKRKGKKKCVPKKKAKPSKRGGKQ